MNDEEAALRRQLHERLQAWEIHPLPLDGRRAAAVALPVVEAAFGPDLAGLPQHAQWQAGPALLLTRRATTLRAHAGQWALPGGRIDAGETPEQAALRELAEEVGLQLGPEAVLGRLDDYVTRSGYRITPLVVWAGAARDLQANADEVASLHRIPFDALRREDAVMLSPSPDAGRMVLRMRVGEGWIAAPTAAFLVQFREVCLLGRPTRVAHFDQPPFAWR